MALIHHRNSATQPANKKSALLSPGVFGLIAGRLRIINNHCGVSSQVNDLVPLRSCEVGKGRMSGCT